MRKRKELYRTYEILLERFGGQDWWPANTPFEVVAGAILTQATSWKNVEKAIENLKKEGILTPQGLYTADEKRLAELIRPAGYYNAKARKVKEFMNHLYRHHGGDLDALFSLPAEELRKELLSIWGIGPETADSIVLYAAGKPSFVVDAYTKRVFHRLGYVKEDIGYDDLKSFSEKNVPRDAKVYNEFHALIVRLGKEHCRKTKPLCGECPLHKRCQRKTRSRKR